MNARAETRTTPGRPDCIAAAAEFVAAQPDGPTLALARHRRLADGNCASCVATPTPWPCTTAVIAQIAGRLPTTPSPVVHAEPHPEPAPRSAVNPATNAAENVEGPPPAVHEPPVGAGDPPPRTDRNPHDPHGQGDGRRCVTRMAGDPHRRTTCRDPTRYTTDRRRCYSICHCRSQRIVPVPSARDGATRQTHPPPRVGNVLAFTRPPPQTTGRSTPWNGDGNGRDHGADTSSG